MKKEAKELIESLKKSMKLDVMSGDSEDVAYDRIPFDIPNLDRMLGGGIPKKRFTLIKGNSNAGKSFLASQVVAKVQKNGGLAAWIDSELSWDAAWMEKCGVDTSSVLLVQPYTGEEAMKGVFSFLEAGVDVVVLDSIAGLIPSDVAAKVKEGDFSYSPMAWQARFVTQSIGKIMAYLKHGSAFVAINQLRENLASIYAPNTTPGGHGQTFFSHLILNVRRGPWIEETVKGDRVRTGFEMKIEMDKTKVGGDSWANTTVPYTVEGGIDVLETYIREAIDKGVIKKTGSWYSFGDIRVQGMTSLKDAIKENEELVEQIKNDPTTNE